MDEEDDPSATLSPGLRRRVDRAFDNALESVGLIPPRPQKRRRLAVEDPSSAPGGFIVGNADPSEAGGFIVEGGRSRDEAELLLDDGELATHIPLSLVPAALQFLDISPDDEEVLNVFRQAASGWSADNGHARTLDSGEAEESRMVSRKDFRAVCAVLLDSGDSLGEIDMENGTEVGTDSGGVEGDANTEEADEDAYKEDFEMSEEEPSDDDYVEGTPTKNEGRRSRGKEGASPRRQRRPTRAVEPPSSDDEDEERGAKPLTARQKHEAKEIFALFFPDVAVDSLAEQRITIKNIAQAAQLLGEKLTAEDILEMLEAYSTSRDRSMTLDDFGRMLADIRRV